MQNEDRRAHFYLLVFIGCIGIILRIYYVLYYSLWLDEMMQVMVAVAPWKNFFGLVATHSSPPLDYALMKAVILLFGKSDWMVRVPALLCGSASIYVFYSFARSLTGRDTALTAAALLSLSPMAIVYSQEARMYSLFLLLSLISFGLTRRIIEKNNLTAHFPLHSSDPLHRDPISNLHHNCESLPQLSHVDHPAGADEALPPSLVYVPA